MPEKPNPPSRQSEPPPGGDGFGDSETVETPAHEPAQVNYANEEEKLDLETTNPHDQAANEPTRDDVATIAIPVSEPVQVNYTDDVPPGPPGLEIHPRRPLPPLPEAPPDAETPQRGDPRK